MKITVDFDYNGFLADEKGHYETYVDMYNSNPSAPPVLARVDMMATITTAAGDAELFFQPKIDGEDFTVLDIDGDVDAQNFFTLYEGKGEGFVSADDNPVEINEAVVKLLFDEADENCWKLKEDVLNEIESIINSNFADFIKTRGYTLRTE